MARKMHLPGHGAGVQPAAAAVSAQLSKVAPPDFREQAKKSRR